MNRSLQLLLGALALTASAQAQQKTWCIELTGAEEVPPVSTSATATAMFTLDEATGALSWNITHQGVTGNHTATHLHGPAGVGSNGGIQVNLGTGNPVVGTAFLTASQVNMLNTDMLYVNLHTSGFPPGELRGQVDDVVVTTLCTSLANSFDSSGARLTTEGDFVTANNAFELTGTGVPPGKFGMLVIGQGSTQVTPPGSSGLLCLAGAPIGRFNTQIKIADASGVLGPFTPDILNLPNPPGGSVIAGESWNLQSWFRDAGNTSNFTDALTVTFK